MPAPYQIGGGPSRRSAPVPQHTGPTRAGSSRSYSADSHTHSAGGTAYVVDDWGGTGAGGDYQRAPGSSNGSSGGAYEGFATPDDVHFETAEEQGPPRAKGPAPTRRPWLGYLIFCGCIAGFAYSLVITPGIIAPLNQNPLIGPTPDSLVASGAKVTCLINQGGAWWRLVSPMWLHAGVVHLVGAFTRARALQAARVLCASS